MAANYYGDDSENEDLRDPTKPSRLSAATGGYADSGDASNISDGDALTVASLMETEMAAVVRNTVDKFVEIKLRILKEHETVCNDKDTMYTTKIRKMQETIDR